MSAQSQTFRLDDLDIAPLTSEQEEKALKLIEQIRHGVADINMNRFDIGSKMLQLCEIIGYGSFEPIRKEFFSVKRRTAQRYMAVAREFGTFRENALELYFSDLAKIAENARLSGLRTELLEALQRNERPDKSYYNTKISEILNEINDEAESLEAGDGDSPEGETHVADKKSRKRSERKNVELMDNEKNMLDELIPRDVNKQKTLLSLLESESDKKKYIEYIISRLRDLTREYSKLPHADEEVACA